MNEIETKKPWYKSKITLLSLITGFVLLSDYFLHWITGQVTPEQLQIIQATAPQTAQSVTSAIENHSIIEAVSAIGSFFVAIWRVWFTDGKIK